MREDYLLNQSGLKGLEKEDTCFKKWYHREVLGEFKMSSTIYMDRGNYFEHLCLGDRARDYEAVTELPLLKNGEKPVAHQRLEQQAARFKDFVNPAHPDFKGLIFLDTQISYKNLELGRRGDADIRALRVKDNAIVILDLKCTAKINTNPKFNPFSWADPKRVDFTQQAYYVVLAESLGLEVDTLKLIAGVWVFDYSPEMEFREYYVTVTPKTKKAIQFRCDTAWDAINNFKKDEENIPRIPSKKECSDCPLICEEREL